MKNKIFKISVVGYLLLLLTINLTISPVAKADRPVDFFYKMDVSGNWWCDEGTEIGYWVACVNQGDECTSYLPATYFQCPNFKQ